MATKNKKLGTFGGVFTPTILTILGVMMYLRLGWAAGNAGLGGVLIILLLCKLVTITTSFSIASMATNTRIGAGGTYAFVSRSLGAEVGSAIGIPLYLSQTIGGAVYLIGFTESWMEVFPGHNFRLVAITALIILFIISIISAKTAIKAQYFIMTIVVISLVSFFLGRPQQPHNIVVWGNYPQESFWGTFSIIFPAVTGIEAGLAMSGDLKDPRKNLPTGILIAIFVSMVIYFAMAYWYQYLGTEQELLSDKRIVLKLSRFSHLVLAGIFGATLSSALGSIVGAPRTLLALGRDNVLPASRLFAKTSKNGEPRNAIIITGILMLLFVLPANLDLLAKILTMFFLIAYGTINLSVFIEKMIGIPSFRPTFKIPIVIPLVGTLWCLVAMFLINPVFAVIAIVCILVVYLIQVKRGLTTPWGDVRAGLFTAIAEWATKISVKMPQHAKSWKPHFLIPVEDPKSWTHLMEFVKEIIFPKGTLRLFSVLVTEKGFSHYLSQAMNRIFKKKSNSVNKYDHSNRDQLLVLEDQLHDLIKQVVDDGVFTAATVVEANNFIEGISIITQVTKGMFFPPNIIFLTMSQDPDKDSNLRQLLTIAMQENIGILLLTLYPKADFGTKEYVNVWLRSRSPNKNLSILLAVQLARNWNSKTRLLMAVENDNDVDKRDNYLDKVIDRARLPVNTEKVLLPGNFFDALNNTPRADLHVFGLSNELDLRIIRKIYNTIGATCIFVRDSGQESLLA